MPVSNLTRATAPSAQRETEVRTLKRPIVPIEEERGHATAGGPRTRESDMTTQPARHAQRHAIPVLLGLLIGTSCVANRPPLDTVPTADPAVRIELAPGGDVVTLRLEEYVAGSILAEADVRGLNMDAAQRVAQVQAILARTYALSNRSRHAQDGFDLCSTTHCQVYHPADALPQDGASLATSAARATTGLVITYEGRPINALFHADCGGGTSDATVAWGGPTPPYLHAVGDLFCLADAPDPWRFIVSRTELRDALNLDPRTQVGHHLEGVRTTEEDEAGRVVRVELLGRESASDVRGEELRHVLNDRFGPRSIKSTRFSVRQEGDQFLFEGRGWGHGIGLCQRGAAARARTGHTPAEIFHHYYPGTSLTQYY